VASPARLPEDLLARVRDGERVELPEDGAAVVPIEDLRLLEAIEDAEDAAEIARRLADPNDLPVPYEDVRRRLGLA
jgi:antitoxin (DNA-binding transcriptional repressor) of toxin-antitoxin stability system